VLGRVVLIAGLGAVSLAAVALFFNRRTPNAHQPAMAVQAFCFLPDKFPPVLGMLASGGTPGLRHLVLFFLVVFVPVTWTLGSVALPRAQAQKFRWVLHTFPSFTVISIQGLVSLLMTIEYMEEWRTAQEYIGPATSEKVWGFGQIVPMFLLAAPILAFVGALLGA
jgi:hypothetical protein